MKSTVLSLSLAVLLSGCAHQLPTDQATAFKTLAAANRDSFQNLAAAEDESVRMFVQREVLSGNGAVRPTGCGLAITDKNCVLVWESTRGTKIELAPTAANTRAVIGALADYGDQMATLAEAEDVATAQASVEGVSTAVKGLATAVGLGPIAGVFIDAATWAGKAQIIDKRRRALLQAARTANPAVQAAATRMQQISAHLQSNLTVTARSRIDTANLTLRDAASSKEQRIAAFADMTDAAQDLQSARDLSTDYRPLGTAHNKLIAALEDPKRRTSEAIADLKTFLSLLEAAKAANKPAEEA